MARPRAKRGRFHPAPIRALFFYTEVQTQKSAVPLKNYRQIIRMQSTFISLSFLTGKIVFYSC